MSGNRNSPNQDYIMQRRRELASNEPDVKWRPLYVALDRLRYHHLVKALRKQGIEAMTQAEVYKRMKK